MRWHQTKPVCMVRRRSTVRFRNGAPLKNQVRSSLDSSHPTLRMGAVAVLGGIWEIVSFRADGVHLVGPRGSADRCRAPRREPEACRTAPDRNPEIATTLLTSRQHALTTRHCARDSPCRAALDPGDHYGPWDQEKRAGPGLPRQRARDAQTPRWRACASTWRAKETDELASGTQKAENNTYPSQALESVKHPRHPPAAIPQHRRHHPQPRARDSGPPQPAHLLTRAAPGPPARNDLRALVGRPHAPLRVRLTQLGVNSLSECLINDPMAPWSWGGARLVPWRVC